MLKLGGKLKGALSDFSMASFYNEATHISLIKHSQSSEDKELMGKLLKTASAVNTMMAQYGSYVARPRLPRKHFDGKKARPEA